jgi:8-oxo-dGTP pyrophosphatase MutT (NUDIX family)
VTDAPHLTPPTWLTELAAAVDDLGPEDLSRFPIPPDGGRPSAVLMLFGEGERGTDLLLIQRSRVSRSHAGQPAFPGGTTDPDDVDAVATALREAHEETGLDPAGVEVLAELPGIPVPVSGFVVTPVLGWWREPSPVFAADPDEVESVARVPLEDLINPELRVKVRHPSGYVGPGFEVAGMLVWGFTGVLLDRLLELAGLVQPRDDEDVRLVDLDSW